MTYVQPLLERIPQPSLRRLQLRMRGMLRPPGRQHQPRQGIGGQDAGGYYSFSIGTRPQSHPRLREPLIGETELSIEEIAHARKIGVIA